MKNIRELRTPGQKVLTQEQYELFAQQFVQYYQEKEGDDLHYNVLGLNESSTEDDMKISYRSMALLSHPEKNKLPQASDVMLMIKKAKAELEDTFCYNDAIREQERVRMAQKYIEIFSDSLSSSSSDDSLETLYNESSTFPAKHKSDN